MGNYGTLSQGYTSKKKKVRKKLEGLSTIAEKILLMDGLRLFWIS